MTLVGRNRAYIEERLPHVAQLMSDDWEELARQADVFIIGKRLVDSVRLSQTLSSEQTVIDLVGIDLPGAVLRPWAAEPTPSGGVELLGAARARS